MILQGTTIWVTLHLGQVQQISETLSHISKDPVLGWAYGTMSFWSMFLLPCYTGVATRNVSRRREGFFPKEIRREGLNCLQSTMETVFLSYHHLQGSTQRVLSSWEWNKRTIVSYK